MRKIAKITENDRKALFHNTAAKMGMTDASWKAIKIFGFFKK